MGSVISQDKYTAFRNCIGICDPFLCICRKCNFSCLGCSVYEKRSCVIHCDHIGFASQDTPYIIHDNIFFFKILFQPITDEKISGLHCREHFIIRCLAYKKNLCKQQPANGHDQHDPPEKTDVAFLYFCRISSFPDCLRTGLIFFSTHHLRTSSLELYPVNRSDICILSGSPSFSKFLIFANHGITAFLMVSDQCIVPCTFCA